MNRLDRLRDRGRMLSEARSFFSQRGVLEVDVPLLSTLASVDAHIDLIPATYADTTPCYLHSSPEYGMKRLLSEGIGDIFQLSHVFRDGELGRKHNPEFMMAEWYRLALSFDDLIDETLDFCRLFLGSLPAKKLTYKETFLTYAGLDYLADNLPHFCQTHNIPLYPGIESEGRDSYLNLILSQYIEPRLGNDHLFVLSHYPSSQAALAITTLHGAEKVAERFEIYYRGIELANGYHELCDPCEQENRLHEANRERLRLQKKSLPLDSRFLEALRVGLPPCSGVAVGFDRLMMLRHNQPQISSVLPFSFTNS